MNGSKNIHDTYCVMSFTTVEVKKKSLQNKMINSKSTLTKQSNPLNVSMRFINVTLIQRYRSFNLFCKLKSEMCFSYRIMFYFLLKLLQGMGWYFQKKK